MISITARRYHQIAARYRQRFQVEPWPLPSDPTDAVNLVRQMIAELNGKTRGTIRRGEPLAVPDAAEVRAEREAAMEEAKRGSGTQPDHPAQHPNGRRNRYDP